MSKTGYSIWSELAKHLAEVCDVRSRRSHCYKWARLLVLIAAAQLARRG